MLTGNKGEWSEVYTLFKILSDKNLFAGNSNLQQLANVIYPVIQIIRNEKKLNIEFTYNNTNVNIVTNTGQSFVIPITRFTAEASTLLSSILGATSTTFNVPSAESFLNSFGSNSIKAKSSSKSDIIIKIHDTRTGMQPTLGFSIKSQLGGNSTLLNSSKATNFKYKVVGHLIGTQDIKRINSISTKSKIQDRLTEINKLGANLELVGALNSNFNNNLILIDSLLPSIVGEGIVHYFNGTASKISDVVDELVLSNPANFDMSSNHNFYEYKFKRLLMDVALGMMPSKVWTGQYDVTGGYLIVKSTGDVVCYHIYNKNEFENYLYNNTKFDTGSSSRQGFGELYIENTIQYFNLNTQIRFF
jgi:hypothetical protein